MSVHLAYSHRRAALAILSLVSLAGLAACDRGLTSPDGILPPDEHHVSAAMAPILPPHGIRATVAPILPPNDIRASVAPALPPDEIR